MNPETDLGGRNRRFPTTAFSIFRLLREGSDGERGDALRRLAELYWKPVYGLIRYGWRKSNEDAKDLTQGFFVDVVFEGAIGEKFAPDRGGFRSFLKASVTNYMRDETKAAGRQKRGGDLPILSLSPGEVDLEGLIAGSAATQPEQIFDAAWRHSVMSKAVMVMADRLHAEGKDELYEIFRRYDLESSAEAPSYAEMAKQLGITPDKVKHALTAARQELRRAVIETVGEYVGSEEEIRREIEELFGS